MSAFKGTPGPWQYVKSNPTPTTGEHLIKGQTPGYLAEIRELSKGHAIANANLIAAAPELLECCMEFVRKVECGEARSKRSYAQMKAAIAKALGQ